MIKKIIQHDNKQIILPFKDVKTGDLFKLSNKSDAVYIKTTLYGVTSENYSTTQVGYINILTGSGDSVEDIEEHIKSKDLCYMVNGTLDITNKYEIN